MEMLVWSVLGVDKICSLASASWRDPYRTPDWKKWLLLSSVSSSRIEIDSYFNDPLLGILFIFCLL